MEDNNRTYPYDETQNESTVEHEVDIAAFVELMKKKNVSVTDLPEFIAINSAHNVKVENLEVKLENGRHLIKVLRDAGEILWKNIKDNMGDMEAWDWVKDNLTEEMRDELDISFPRKYRIVDVVLKKEMRLAVPENFCDYQIENLAIGLADDFAYDYESDEVRSNISEDDLMSMRIDNDTEEFDDSDFE